MKKITAMLLVVMMLCCGCSAANEMQTGRNPAVKMIVELPNGEVIEGCPDWFYTTDPACMVVCFDGVIYMTGMDNIATVSTGENNES